MAPILWTSALAFCPEFWPQRHNPHTAITHPPDGPSHPRSSATAPSRVLLPSGPGLPAASPVVGIPSWSLSGASEGPAPAVLPSQLPSPGWLDSSQLLGALSWTPSVLQGCSLESPSLCSPTPGPCLRPPTNPQCPESSLPLSHPPLHSGPAPVSSLPIPLSAGQLPAP